MKYFIYKDKGMNNAEGILPSRTALMNLLGSVKANFITVKEAAKELISEALDRTHLNKKKTLKLRVLIAAFDDRTANWVRSALGPRGQKRCEFIQLKSDILPGETLESMDRLQRIPGGLWRCTACPHRQIAGLCISPSARSGVGGLQAPYLERENHHP